MADTRFYDNKGPFTLAAICVRAGVSVPDGANPDAAVADVASLAGAGPHHLSFLSGTGAANQFAQTKAGFCFVSQADAANVISTDVVLVPTSSVQHAFAEIAAYFYPDHLGVAWPQSTLINASAQIGKDVLLGPGVVIGADAEIGDGTRIAPNTVIGRGVAIGRNCEIGANVTISHSYIGDEVLILPGAQIGQPGFGFASDGRGHRKIPQLGRVIIQDRVEIGSCTTVDRGALGDTVIGEGTKIDNLVQIGHNNHLGRHDMIVGQVGLSEAASWAISWCLAGRWVSPTMFGWAMGRGSQRAPAHRPAIMPAGRIGAARPLFRRGSGCVRSRQSPCWRSVGRRAMAEIKTELDVEEIKNLLPHRAPFSLRREIDRYRFG